MRLTIASFMYKMIPDKNKKRRYQFMTKQETQNTQVIGKRAFSTLTMVQMAMFAALLAVSAYISIPLPLPGSPHITLQNFLVILIALLFPVSESFTIILVWMLLGAVGAPVFIGGKAGIGYLVSNPWAGYTLAFLAAALLLPKIRGLQYKRLRYTIAAVIGVLVIDVIGMVFLRFYPESGYNWALAVSGGFFAFLPLDLAKAVIAAMVVPAFEKVMKQQ